MPIARFVTAKDIQRIHNERNPENPIGYGMACTIKQTCREKYEPSSLAMKAIKT